MPSTDPFPSPRPTSSCSASQEEALHAYLDGELPFGRQPALFSHLADCADCRHTLNAVLAFRRMSRQEVLDVPPAADDAFFKRLDAIKRRGAPDRGSARRTLWQVRTPVSFGMAALAALTLFLAGLFMPVQSTRAGSEVVVQGTVERVDLNRRVRPEAVYVFYPGLVVEAAKVRQVRASDVGAP